MVRQFESELSKLKEEIMSMGGHVEKALHSAVEGITDRKPHLFEEVRTHEQMINEAHLRVDELSLNLLARQAPLAKDLRLILAVVKINTDLERMGDQAMNISYNGRDYLNNSPVQTQTDLKDMAYAVRHMVKNALDSFVRRDTTLAQSVLESDDEVDRYKQAFFNELKEKIKQRPDLIDPCVDLMLIARNLERLADHATNIAEDVIFFATGSDIRHGQSQSAES